MDRRTFGILCDMVRDIGGLKDTRNASVDEIVAFFIYVLAYHKKNRTISLLFHRSQETVSRHFNLCLHAILKLYHILLKTLEPISENYEDDRWKPFKGYLGALDDTFIPMTPPKEEKQRYHTRKGGSAHDDRVLHDAISRPTRLKVPQGCYYLVDAGYCNSSGFLAPYRGHRYHLNELDGHRPETLEEYFNMKHSRDIMYSKDRATGDLAEDPLAAEQNLGNVDVTLTMTDESNSNAEIEFLSTMESLPSNSSSSRVAKKKCPHQVHKASKKTKFAPVNNAETEYKEFNDEIREVESDPVSLAPAKLGVPQVGDPPLEVRRKR
ncbi:hypothetical protein ZIOFF_048093 [Zingiber officinale]|uniref:DUF8040 domain-containing protein n=1 Tax=Zingiber officinale TaxID=94328 RepID=A0A8J5FYM0_ZINOF|nr:hypothetical protein ZIOFF_048093 [Zingiber officinale]